MLDRVRLFVGIAVWIMLLATTGIDLWNPRWIVQMIAFGVLVLVPVANCLLEPSGISTRRSLLFRMAETGAGVSFAAGLSISVGRLAVALAVPWVVVLALSALMELREFRSGNGRLMAIRGYALVGAVFGVLHCAEVRPLDFPPVIVLLTVTHFHFAGFLVPVLALLLETRRPGRATRGIAWAIVVGMFATAIGINATQLGSHPLIETVTAGLFVAAVAALAIAQMKLATDDSAPAVSRLLWGTGALCAVAGTLLALGYVLRFTAPELALSIREMAAVHGTLMTFGFQTPSLLAWTIAQRTGSRVQPRSVT